MTNELGGTVLDTLATLTGELDPPPEDVYAEAVDPGANRASPAPRAEDGAQDVDQNPEG
jgi:hypothetical protein